MRRLKKVLYCVIFLCFVCADAISIGADFQKYNLEQIVCFFGTGKLSEIVRALLLLCVKVAKKMSSEPGGFNFNLPLTLAAIVAAIMVFLYSILDTRRLGIPTRGIIVYQFGQGTIQFTFILMVVLLVLMEFFGWFDYKYTQFLLYCETIFIELWLIFVILYYSTWKKSKDSILIMGKENYKMILDDINASADWAVLGEAMISDESISNRLEFMKNYLEIPLVFPQKIYNDIYQYDISAGVFWFQNLRLMFQALDDANKSMTIKECIIKIENWLKEIAIPTSDKIKLLLAISVVTALSSTESGDSLEYTIYFLNRCSMLFPEKDYVCLLNVWILFGEYYAEGTLQVKKERRLAEMLENVNKIDEWSELSLEQNFDIGEEDQMAGFWMMCHIWAISFGLSMEDELNYMIDAKEYLRRQQAYTKLAFQELWWVNKEEMTV